MDKFDRELKKRDSYTIYYILDAIVDFEYPEATDRLIQLFERKAKVKTRYYYYGGYAAAMVSRLPKKSAVAIEKILPKLPDKMVDDILPHLQTLKTKTK